MGWEKICGTSADAPQPTTTGPGLQDGGLDGCRRAVLFGSNARTRIFRTAPVVSQVAMPSGRHSSTSMRMPNLWSFRGWFTTCWSLIQAWMAASVTRMRTRYHLWF